jgi:hypothetical protein
MSFGICGENTHPHAVFALKAINCFFHCLGKIVIDGIACIGAIQSDHSNVTTNFISNHV